MSKVHLDLNMNMSETDERYMRSCARIRRISATRLISRMVQTVCSEQLVLAIMDDNSQQPAKLPGEHGKSKYRCHRVEQEDQLS